MLCGRPLQRVLQDDASSCTTDSRKFPARKKAGRAACTREFRRLMTTSGQENTCSSEAPESISALFWRMSRVRAVKCADATAASVQGATRGIEVTSPLARTGVDEPPPWRLRRFPHSLDVTSDQHPHDQKNSGADRDASEEMTCMRCFVVPHNERMPGRRGHGSAWCAAMRLASRLNRPSAESCPARDRARSSRARGALR